MRRCLLVLTGVLLAVHIFGQHDFIEGYIVNAKGDTTHGLVDYRANFLMEKVCVFRKTEKDTIYEYQPIDLQSYKVNNRKFVTKNIDNKSKFIEQLVSGKLNLYCRSSVSNDVFYLENEKYGFRELFYLEAVVSKSNGRRYNQKSTRHIGILKVYMEDRIDLFPRIENMRTLERAFIVKLVRDYNGSTENATGNKEKVKKRRVSYEFTAGNTYFEDMSLLREDANSGPYLTGGILLHINPLRSSDRFFIKTGLLVGGGSSMPVQVEYMFPISYRVRPYASISLLSPSYSAGVMVRVFNIHHIGVQTMLDYSVEAPLFIIPKKLICYSVMCSYFIDVKNYDRVNKRTPGM